MNDDTLTNLVARGLVDEVIHLFNKYLGTQLKIRNEKRVLPYISKKRRKTQHKALTAFDIISSEDVSELSNELGISEERTQYKRKIWRH
ncbi:hypothetical protein [Lactococcus lactis]|uniref:hypothetical protein n=1 Tax=Lactococcus lactis TaxID=1358 RepID=UPI0024E0B5FF|nr:hypothetical protein [Lactococcus lactis]WIF24035.1 hypothetical protein LL267_03180 [Lactococcus lactis subsp. lactis]